jgi:molybdopterin/thiamine biosynthesis adenylyltransferase
MLRYSAHLPLTGIGAEGQQRIANSHVVLIGVGGLGCAAAQYLVSSGIGKLTLCDFDIVAESNLSRQILYRPGDIGRLKTEAATDALQSLNPDTDLRSVSKRMSDEDMQTLFPACDLVIDASDNYGTRLAVNRSCLALKLPWIMASCIRMEGQIMFMRPDLSNQACYRCAYGTAPDTLEDCPGAGIFAPVAGIVGTSAAHFALSSLAGLQPPSGLHLFDAANWQWQSLKIRRNDDCRDCKERMIPTDFTDFTD